MAVSPAFPRRFLAVWMPLLPTDRRRRRYGTEQLDPATPLVLVGKADGAQRIMAADQAARQLGLEAGMGLAQARAMVPGVCAMPFDAEGDAQLLEAIADWADRYTPLVGRDPPQGLMLDITGAAHLLGGETALVTDLVERLGRQGVQAAVGLAPTVGAAWALARHGGDLARTPEDISRAGLDAILAPLPIGGLRLAPEIVASLRRVGLKRIGDLFGRPRSALAARFGAQLILRLDQARGIDTEAINPRQPIPQAQVEHTFAEPILTTGAVEQCCRVLADRLAALLEDRGQGATALQLAVYRVDGLVRRIELRLASPCRHGPTMAGLLVLRLAHLDDPLDPGFGYDLVRLAATGVAGKEAETRRLAGLGAEASAEELAQARTALIDRLGARFGEGDVESFSFAATHIPERAAGLSPVRARLAKVDRRAKLDGLAKLDGRAKRDSWAPSGGNESMTPTRPVRLLQPPEPVDVMAEVPDGPPVHLRWRRRPVRIVAAHGPERIAPEWWVGTVSGAATARADETRDYWRVEDATGRRLWLYREGFYGASGMTPESRPPRWYVHGLFA